MARQRRSCHILTSVKVNSNLTHPIFFWTTERSFMQKAILKMATHTTGMRDSNWGHYTGPHILRDSLGFLRIPQESLRTSQNTSQTFWGLWGLSEDFLRTFLGLSHKHRDFPGTMKDSSQGLSEDILRSPWTSPQGLLGIPWMSEEFSRTPKDFRVKSIRNKNRPTRDSNSHEINHMRTRRVPAEPRMICYSLWNNPIWQ
jgi:hypothetical protein